MGYVGNQTSNSYSSMDKQTITGNGGASYTLTHAVANAQEIEVFVNNVRQEAGVAYTVAGTALSMTGNVASTDDFYVIYQGKALQTVVPPDGSVTSAKLDTNIAVAGTLTTVGNVGIGTTSPSYLLDVIGNTNGSVVSRIGNLSTGASSQAIVQIGAGASAERYVNLNTNYTSQYFQISGASITTSYKDFDTQIFRNNSGAERMRIDSSGNLSVGSTSAVNVASGTTDGVTLKPNNVEISRDGGTPLLMRRRSSNGEMVAFRRDTTFVGSISVTASSTAYNTSSDYRLKENVTDITGATDRLKQLNPVRFNFIADADTTVDGFLAHEVQDVVPEAITGTKDGMRDEEYEVTPAVLDDDGNVVTEAVMGTRSVPDYQGIDQSKLVPLLVKTIQELEARIAALEAN